MLIDTHCHLDATEFDVDRDAVLQAALDAGLGAIVMPAVERANFQHVINLAKQSPHVRFALGIHPMYVDSAHPSDLSCWRSCLKANPIASLLGRLG